MGANPDYADMFRHLNARGARYLVVGAYAVVFHTEPRYTKDIDIWILPTPENARRVFDALAAFGAPLEGVVPEDFADPDIVYQVGVEPNRIDLLTRVGNLDFEECWERAAVRYDIPVKLLQAIAYVESRMLPDARKINRNGSIDYGLMQVNSRWLRYLKPYGITGESLKEPCTNIMVGAWILKQEILRYGFNWMAVGAYHAGAYTRFNESVKRERYISYSLKVYNVINRNYVRVR